MPGAAQVAAGDADKPYRHRRAPGLGEKRHDSQTQLNFYILVYRCAISPFELLLRLNSYLNQPFSPNRSNMASAPSIRLYTNRNCPCMFSKFTVDSIHNVALTNLIRGPPRSHCAGRVGPPVRGGKDRLQQAANPRVSCYQPQWKGTRNDIQRLRDSRVGNHRSVPG